MSRSAIAEKVLFYGGYAISLYTQTYAFTTARGRRGIGVLAMQHASQMHIAIGASVGLFSRFARQRGQRDDAHRD